VRGRQAQIDLAPPRVAGALVGGAGDEGAPAALSALLRPFLAAVLGFTLLQDATQRAARGLIPRAETDGEWGLHAVQVGDTHIHTHAPVPTGRASSLSPY
jgi:hypothetical protein